MSASSHATVLENKPTRWQVHHAARQSQKQSQDLHSVPLVLLRHPLTLLAPNATLPNRVRDMRVRITVRVDLLRQGEARQEQVVYEQVY